VDAFCFISIEAIDMVKTGLRKKLALKKLSAAPALKIGRGVTDIWQ
jgi:hypothetical protein